MKNTDFNGLPYTPKKKQEDKQLRVKRLLCKKNGELDAPNKEDQTRLLQMATLSATTSPYLRALIMVGESDSHYYMTIVQSNEETLSKEEISGALIYASRVPGENRAFPIREESVTRYIKMTNMYNHFKNEVDYHHLKNISLATIHHDYVRYFGEGSGTLEGVIVYHLLQNGFTETSKVIRSM